VSQPCAFSANQLKEHLGKFFRANRVNSNNVAQTTAFPKDMLLAPPLVSV